MRNNASTHVVSQAAEQKKISSFRDRIKSVFKAIGLASVLSMSHDAVGSACKPTDRDVKDSLVEVPFMPRPLGDDSPMKTVRITPTQVTEVQLKVTERNPNLKLASFAPSTVLQDSSNPRHSNANEMVILQKGKKVNYSHGEAVIANGVFRIPEGMNTLGHIELSIYEDLTDATVTIDLSRPGHTMKSGERVITMVPVIANGTKGYIAKSSIRKPKIELVEIPTVQQSVPSKDVIKEAFLEAETPNKKIEAKITVRKKKTPQYGSLERAPKNMARDILTVNGFELDKRAFKKAIGIIESAGGKMHVHNAWAAKKLNVDLSKAAFGYAQFTTETINTYAKVLYKYTGISRFDPENTEHRRVLLQTQKGHDAQRAMHDAYMFDSARKITSNPFLVEKMESGELSLASLMAMAHHAGQGAVSGIYSNRSLIKIQNRKDWLNTKVGNYSKKVEKDYFSLLQEALDPVQMDLTSETLADNASPEIESKTWEAQLQRVPQVKKTSTPTHEVIAQARRHMWTLIGHKIDKDYRRLEWLDVFGRQKLRASIGERERHKNQVSESENLLQYYQELIRFQEKKVLSHFDGSSERMQEESVLNEYKGEYSHMLGFVQMAMQGQKTTVIAESTHQSPNVQKSSSDSAWADKKLADMVSNANKVASILSDSKTAYIEKTLLWRQQARESADAL